MARLARGEYLDPGTVQIVHVVSRCVRRAYLCGKDSVTGQSFEHRREWIRQRLEFLASIFGVDCLTFAVMENHLHLVLRSRPDIVGSWSDEEVARRWLRLCPVRSGEPPSELEVGALLADRSRIGKLRVRLSDISWWQRMLSQKVARMANREDECTGRFWEGRYRAQLLLDEGAVLACAMYVDLNPIRAAMAQSLEDSGFTGAKARIDDLKASGGASKKRRSRRSTRRWERSRGRLWSGWLSPLELAKSAESLGPEASQCGRRASLKGFLTMSVARYLELLDWTGRQLRAGKRGAIPSHILPILDRLGISTDGWLDLASRFGRLFKRAAGTRVSLAAEAGRRGQRWMQGPGADCIG